MTDIQTININKFELKLKDTDDPVAQKVSWDPARPGGFSFKAQTLTETSLAITIGRSTAALLSGLFFLIPGALSCRAALGSFEETGDILFGIIFFLGGLAIMGSGYYFFIRQKKFTIDKRRGVYFVGKEYRQGISVPLDEQGKVSEIHALQLLAETVSSTNPDTKTRSSYTSYEINLVFKNGSRLNIMDHRKLDHIEKSARILAAYLKVPVWQAEY